MAGQQPIVGATIQVYAAGTSGASSPAQPLLNQTSLSSATGQFSVRFSCPTASSTIYLTTAGGGTGSYAGTGNPASSLMAVEGTCGSLSSSTVLVNEVTTIGSIWPYASYLASASALGSSAADADFSQAATFEDQLIDVLQGTSPGSGIPEGFAVQTSKLDVLANLLHACIDSPGGTAGDGSPCGLLFSWSKPPGKPAPSDTLMAALQLANNPQENVSTLFGLVPAMAPFQPVLAAPPADWTLPLVAIPAPPTFSPSGGTYAAGEQITLTEETANATVHYTTDGSQPSSNSPVYSAPLTLSANETISAVAMTDAISSTVSSAVYTIAPPGAPVFSPAPGSYPAAQAVTLTDSDTAAAIYYTSNNATPTASSTRYTGPISVPASATLRAVAIDSGNASAVASGSYTIAPPPAISISLASPTITTGSTGSGTLLLSPAPSGTITVSLISSTPSSVSVSAASLNLAAGQTTASFSYTGVSPGSASLDAAAEGYLSGSASVTDNAAVIPKTFFGMTVQNFTQNPPTISYGTTRSWDADGLDWADLNPSPGTYNFAALDSFISLNQALGVDMIYTFGRTPQWASSEPDVSTPYGPGQCAPPADLATWDSFVTAIVAHAAGRIKYWELWNEPNNTEFWCPQGQDSAGQLVALAQHAYTIIKQIDPAAMVLTPPLTGGLGPQWLSTYLSEGGNQYLDIVGFHGYSSPTAEDIVTVSAGYRNVMASMGLSQTPLWDTESSWATGVGPVPMEAQVAFIPKSYILHWSLGIQRFVWYAWDGGPIWGGLWTAAQGPSPAATSYAQAFQWLTGASLSSPCAENQNDVWSCDLSRPGGYSSQILWITGATATVHVPSTFIQYIDVTGQVHPIAGNTVTVGDEPILVESGNLPQ